MEGRSLGRAAQTALWVVGLAIQPPLSWAQPLEVPDVETTRAAVEVQVDRLVAEVQARDPELAQEIERQGDLCVLDLGDGRLEHEGFLSEIEALREVHTEVVGRVVQAEVEEQVAALIVAGSADLANELRTAFMAVGTAEGMALGGPGAGGAGEASGTMTREEARASFNQAYQEVLGRDPQDAARMKEMFEKCERGEFEDILRPTPEAMERMAGEMKEYMSEHPEMGEYVREFASAEWERFTADGHELGEHGPELGEFERFAAEGHTPGDFERMMGPEGEHEGEFYHEGPETLDDFYRDIAETYRDLMHERDYDARLELLSDLAIALSDAEQQKADSRYSAVLSAAEANLTAAEHADIKNTGAPLHKEALAEVDPARSGEEHLHIDYTKGTEAPLGTHVDARVDLHDHTTDEITKTFTHIQDICPSPGC